MIFSDALFSKLINCSEREYRCLLDELMESQSTINYIGTSNKNPKLWSWLKPALYKSMRCDDFNGNPWEAKYRVVGKPGKLLRKVMPYWSDHAIAHFMNQYKVHNDATLKFRLVSGRDISYYYREGKYNYNFSLGSLGCSCMRGSRFETFEIYEDNPMVKMLIAFHPASDDKIIGRALVWEGVNISDKQSITFMDRIYGNDTTIEGFKVYAKDMGWWYKQRQSFDYKRGVVAPNGEALLINMYAPVNTEGYRFYPYLDTFAFSRSRGLRNYTNDSVRDYHYQSTEGTRERFGVFCVDTQTYEDRDYAHFVRTRGRRGSGEYYRHAVYCSWHDYYVPRDQAINVNEVWYYEDDDQIIETFDGTTLHRDRDDVVELHDGRLAGRGYHNVELVWGRKFALREDIMRLEGYFVLKSDMDAFKEWYKGKDTAGMHRASSDSMLRDTASRIGMTEEEFTSTLGEIEIATAPSRDALRRAGDFIVLTQPTYRRG